MMKGISDWIYSKCNTVQYGEISIVLKLNHGKIVQIEKHVKITERPEPISVGAEHEQSHTA